MIQQPAGIDSWRAKGSQPDWCSLESPPPQIHSSPDPTSGGQVPPSVLSPVEGSRPHRSPHTALPVGVHVGVPLAVVSFRELRRVLQGSNDPANKPEQRKLQWGQSSKSTRTLSGWGRSDVWNVVTDQGCAVLCI